MDTDTIKDILDRQDTLNGQGGRYRLIDRRRDSAIADQIGEAGDTTETVSAAAWQTAEREGMDELRSLAFHCLAAGTLAMLGLAPADRSDRRTGFLSGDGNGAYRDELRSRAITEADVYVARCDDPDELERLCAMSRLGMGELDRRACDTNDSDHSDAGTRCMEAIADQIDDLMGNN